MLSTIFSLVLYSTLFLQKADNLIDWSATRKLTWDDFQGSWSPESPNAALTSSSINVEFGYDKSGLTYSIKCRFNKDKSWGKIKNDYILAHEQGHFDIAEVHARKLNKALKKYVFNSKTVSTDINQIYESVMKEHHATQEKYDLETDHSRIPVKQQEWNKTIQAMLEQYKAFGNYR
jgi:predicted secreted Zn-dependent protease